MDGFEFNNDDVFTCVGCTETAESWDGIGFLDQDTYQEYGIAEVQLDLDLIFGEFYFKTLIHNHKLSQESACESEHNKFTDISNLNPDSYILTLYDKKDKQSIEFKFFTRKNPIELSDIQKILNDEIGVFDIFNKKNTFNFGTLHADPNDELTPNIFEFNYNNLPEDRIYADVTNSWTTYVPLFDPDVWGFGDGAKIRDAGIWRIDIPYVKGDVVVHNNKQYLCINNIPTASSQKEFPVSFEDIEPSPIIERKTNYWRIYLPKAISKLKNIATTQDRSFCDFIKKIKEYSEINKALEDQDKLPRYEFRLKFQQNNHIITYNDLGNKGNLTEYQLITSVFSFKYDDTRKTISLGVDFSVNSELPTQAYTGAKKICLKINSSFSGENKFIYIYNNNPVIEILEIGEFEDGPKANADFYYFISDDPVCDDSPAAKTELIQETSKRAYSLLNVYVCQNNEIRGLMSLDKAPISADATLYISDIFDLVKYGTKLRDDEGYLVLLNKYKENRADISDFNKFIDCSGGGEILEIRNQENDPELSLFNNDELTFNTIQKDILLGLTEQSEELFRIYKSNPTQENLDNYRKKMKEKNDFEIAVKNRKRAIISLPYQIITKDSKIVNSVAPINVTFPLIIRGIDGLPEEITNDPDQSGVTNFEKIFGSAHSNLSTESYNKLILYLYYMANIDDIDYKKYNSKYTRVRPHPTKQKIQIKYAVTTVKTTTLPIPIEKDTTLPCRDEIIKYVKRLEEEYEKFVDTYIRPLEDYRDSIFSWTWDGSKYIVRTNELTRTKWCSIFKSNQVIFNKKIYGVRLTYYPDPETWAVGTEHSASDAIPLGGSVYNTNDERLLNYFGPQDMGGKEPSLASIIPKMYSLKDRYELKKQLDLFLKLANENTIFFNNVNVPDLSGEQSLPENLKSPIISTPAELAEKINFWKTVLATENSPLIRNTCGTADLGRGPAPKK